MNSFVSGWVEGAIEKLPVISPDEESANKINDYIDKEFQNIDRETFKKQLKEAMKNLTEDYEVGLKKVEESPLTVVLAASKRVKCWAIHRNNQSSN